MPTFFTKPFSMISRAATLAFLLAPAASAQTDDLAPDVKSGAVWEMNSQKFQEEYKAAKDEVKGNTTYLGTGGRVEWMDAEKTALRITKPAFKLAGLAPGETIVKFQEDKPVNLQVMLYNKGDDRLLNKKEFDALITQAQGALSAAFENPGKVWTPKANETAIRLKAWQWNIPGCLVSLEYNSSMTARNVFLGEFIRVRITSENAETTSRATKKSLVDNVKREGKRVVIENIPMVDQGEKGYCAAATCARVFMYYGLENIDQHDLASAAKTSAGGGTSTDEMMDAVKKLCIRFKFRQQVVDSLNSLEDYNKLKNFVNKYNLEAKRQKAEQIPINPYLFYNFWNFADAGILKTVRCARPDDVERWMQHVRTWVDKGVPIMWALQVGVAPEPMRISQSRGGHIRLIIGYDDEKKVILFSDSWGEQHACKEMPVQDAMIGTIFRLIVEPR